MGYYTYFTLDMWNEDTTSLEDSVYDDVKAKLASYLVEAGDDKDYAINVVDELCDYGYEMKWYESNDHMTRLAKAFPHVQFELEGKGEDGAWWVAQYWGDKFSEKYAERPSPDLF